MGTASVPSSTLSHFRGYKWDICFLDRKRLELKELLWQHHWGCHFISFVMHSYGAKFQEHCFNISRDIVYSVFCHLYWQTIWRHHWSNLHNRKTSISLKRKKIIQKEKRHSSVFWKAFQISIKYFSCHMHFKPKLFLTFGRAYQICRLVRPAPNLEPNICTPHEHWICLFCWKLKQKRERCH